MKVMLTSKSQKIFKNLVFYGGLNKKIENLIIDTQLNQNKIFLKISEGKKQLKFANKYKEKNKMKILWESQKIITKITSEFSQKK